MPADATLIRARRNLRRMRSLLQGALLVLTAAAGSRADEPALRPGAASAEFPPELVEFVPYERNPVFTGAGKGHWDERIRERGWIVRENGQYRMWYTGFEQNGMMKLGYATSPDGLQWTRYAQNPIYDRHWTEDMMVVEQDGTYYMFAEGKDDQAQLLTSPDGIAWTRQGQLDVRMTDGRPIPPGPYGTPTAWFEKGTWRLLYERSDVGVWLAESADLKSWTNVQDEPVLSPGPDAYDREMIAVNQVVQRDGRYYAYYHGSGSATKPRTWNTNVALSTDLIHWTKYPKNPLLEDNKSSGILVDDGKQLRLYTMHDTVQVHLPKAPARETK